MCVHRALKSFSIRRHEAPGEEEEIGRSGQLVDKKMKGSLYKVIFDGAEEHVDEASLPQGGFKTAFFLWTCITSMRLCKCL